MSCLFSLRTAYTMLANPTKFGYKCQNSVKWQQCIVLHRNEGSLLRGFEEAREVWMGAVSFKRLIEIKRDAEMIAGLQVFHGLWLEPLSTPQRSEVQSEKWLRTSFCQILNFSNKKYTTSLDDPVKQIPTSTLLFWNSGLWFCHFSCSPFSCLC